VGGEVSLRDLTLEGEVDKVAIAIERLRAFEPKDGYYLAFSGGKDSIVILALAKEAGVKFDAHFSQCGGVDPPELIRFIRTFPEVSIDMPPKSMWQLIRKHKMLPTRLRRYCCRELKERGGDGRLVVTGVRWEESNQRKTRRMTERCMKDGSKTYLHPIIDWSEQEVWQYIRERELPYCSLYDEGRKRVGCVLCPFGRPGNIGDAERWPAIAKQYRRLANEVWKPGNFASGDEYFDWWASDRSLPFGAGQLDLGVYE